MHWEWFYGWHTTFSHYFPKYLLEEDPCINSFFATNVPYNFPTDVLWEDHYISLERKVFVFKPREWRGTNPDGAPPFSGANYLSEQKMAEEITFLLFQIDHGGKKLPDTLHNALYRQII